MDYQALFEAGTLTPQQLFEWMKVDRNTAAAALKQRPELQATSRATKRSYGGAVTK